MSGSPNAADTGPAPAPASGDALGSRPVRIMIGGGPAVLARPAGALLVSAGRDLYHRDEPGLLAQSPDMLRDLRRYGFDPYVYAPPRGRVPELAVRVWLDALATQGPVIDGAGFLALNTDRRMVALIYPDRGESLMLEVDGVPLVAPGPPPQAVPGCGDLYSFERAAEALMVRLMPLGDEAVRMGNVLVDVFRGGQGPEGTLAALERHGFAPPASDPSHPLAEPVGALRALVAFRRAGEGGGGPLCHGDEVVWGKVPATAADSWIVAGGGDDALAAAETLLAGNPAARVTVVARRIDTAAVSTARYADLHRRHLADAGGDGRLGFRLGTEPGPVAVGPAGRYVEGGVEADGYVACTGRAPVLPHTVTKLVEWARGNRGRVTGSLLFDENDLYLGYRLHFAAEGLVRHVDVTGAASRFLPAEAFSRALRADLDAMGLRMTPPESGSSPADLLPVVEQAARMAEARQRGTVRELDEVPARVLPLS